MNELFNITNCYQDNNNYYFFRALNRRDMTGIRNGSTLDSNGHINRIVTEDRKSTRLNSSHLNESRMPSSA